MRLQELSELSLLRLDHSILRETVVVVNVDESIFDNDVASEKSLAPFGPAFFIRDSRISLAIVLRRLLEALKAGDRIKRTILLVLK